MNTGDIAIMSFPLTDLVSYKARPAVVIAHTTDAYSDIIVSVITSVVPVQPNPFQTKLPSDSTNNLKVDSVIKVNRIATVENNKVVAVIGKLKDQQLSDFKAIFKSFID